MTIQFVQNGFGAVIATLDHTDDEELVREAEVSASPVEDGGDVVDHTRLLAIGGTFSGLLLDEPGDAETALQRAAGVDIPAQIGRAADALRALQEAMIARELVIILTPLELIEDAILTRVVGRQRAEGVIAVQGSYRVLRRAATALVALPKPAVRAQASKKKSKGSKLAKEASEGLTQKAKVNTIAGFLLRSSGVEIPGG